MGDQRKPDVEIQMESRPLYPQLTEQQPQQFQQQQQEQQETLDMDELDGNITQADLDRFVGLWVWTRLFSKADRNRVLDTKI